MFYKALLKKKNNKNKKAFTLIELIVVIAIIGVLIAILVPTMSGFVQEAQATTNLANARTIYSIAQAEAAFLMAQGTTPDADNVHTATASQVSDIDGGFTVNIDAATGTVSSIVYTPTGGEAITYPAS